MTSPSRPRSPLWMVVLALACEEPMHPYRMQTLIKQRGKDQIANVAQRNSVYQAILALRRAGLIAVRETLRHARRPERTVYEATEQGRQALRSWVRTGLSTPAREYPEFPAALATLYGIDDAADLRALLTIRVDALKRRLPELERTSPNVPRIFLIEDEYMAAVVRAELKWLGGIITDVESKRLTFPTAAQIRAVGVEFGAPSEAAFRGIAANTRDSPKPKRGKRRVRPTTRPSFPGRR